MNAFATPIAESLDSLAGPWRRPHQMLHAQVIKDAHAPYRQAYAGLYA
jgi:hypothetical protein